MGSSSRKVPRIQIGLIPFDFFPSSDRGLASRAVSDICRHFRRNSRQKRIVSECDSFLVCRGERSISIKFMDTCKPERFRHRMTVSYVLAGSM